MTYETIRLDIADNIATITLNRPERLNAMPPQMADEISEALDNLGGARCVDNNRRGQGFLFGCGFAGARRRCIGLAVGRGPIMR